MSVTLKELAAALRLQWTGNPGLLLERVSEFESAAPGSVTLAVGARRERLSESHASAFIVDARSVTDEERERFALLLAPHPKVAFAHAVAKLHVPSYQPGGVAPDFIHGENLLLGSDATIHPRVTVGDNCRIGARVVLHPGVVLGDDVTIGDDSLLFANVTVYGRVTIGARCVIHGGTVIGSDGFGFAQEADGRHVKIPQVGVVVVEDEVEMGANCCIDRATLGVTRIGRGTKLDNLVHIAHNCVVGENGLMAAQVAISGGVTVGRHVTLAGQVGTNPQVSIGDNAVVAGKSGVSKSIAADEAYAGMPIQTLRDWKRSRIFAAQMPTRLPKLEARVAELEKALARLHASQQES